VVSRRRIRHDVTAPKGKLGVETAPAGTGWSAEQARRCRPLTGRGAAGLAGASQLRRYEAGAAEHSLSALRRLATGLSVTADTLALEATDRLPAETRLQLAFEATRQLDKHDRDVIVALLDAFLAHHQHRDGHEGPRAPQRRRTAVTDGATASRRLSRTPSS
jgi:transcriptional regulator with XRE-family HTH domain